MQMLNHVAACCAFGARTCTHVRILSPARAALLTCLSVTFAHAQPSSTFTEGVQNTTGSTAFDVHIDTNVPLTMIQIPPGWDVLPSSTQTSLNLLVNGGDSVPNNVGFNISGTYTGKAGRKVIKSYYWTGPGPAHNQLGPVIVADLGTTIVPVNATTVQATLFNDSASSVTIAKYEVGTSSQSLLGVAADPGGLLPGSQSLLVQTNLLLAAGSSLSFNIPVTSFAQNFVAYVNPLNDPAHVDWFMISEPIPEPAGGFLATSGVVGLSVTTVRRRRRQLRAERP